MDRVVIVGESVAGYSASLRKRIGVLAQDLQRNTFDLAEAFLEAQETPSYLHGWGYETLGDYASQELGIKHRRAQYLARIVRVCRECGVVRKVYEKVEITKLREITSLNPDRSYFNRETGLNEPLVDHIVNLIAEAPELTTDEIGERVAHLKGLDGENSMLTRSYSVTRSAYENVIKTCFESIRMRLGSAGRDEEGKGKEYGDGTVIEALAAEYNSDPRNFMEEETDEPKVNIDVPEEL